MSSRGKRQPIDLDLFAPGGAIPGVAAPQADPAAPVEPLRDEPPSGEAKSTTPDPSARRARKVRPKPQPARTGGDHWSWGPHEVPRTHRYPVELLEAFEDRIDRLKLPVGLTVAAALASLLDLDDDELEEAVLRAHNARPLKLGRR